MSKTPLVVLALEPADFESIITLTDTGMADLRATIRAAEITGTVRSLIWQYDREGMGCLDEINELRQAVRYRELSSAEDVLERCSDTDSSETEIERLQAVVSKLFAILPEAARDLALDGVAEVLR